MRSAWAIAVVGVVLMLFGRSDAVPVAFVVDDSLASGAAGNNSALFNYSGGATTTRTANSGCHNSSFLVAGSSSVPANETFLVGQAPSFSAGTYDIWASWFNSTGTCPATTAKVNGITVATIDMTKDAGQGAANTLNRTGGGSGYYYLGRYALTSSSTVNFSGTSAFVPMDSVLLRNAEAGFLFDDRTATSTNVSLWTANSGTGDGKYTFSTTDYADPSITYAATNRWCGGSSGTGYAGPISLSYAVGVSDRTIGAGMKVQVSWAAGKSGAVAPNNAKYIVDLDGSLATTADQYPFLVNEQLLADGSTPGTANAGGNFQWSGWYTLINPDNVSGLWRLTSSSIVYLTDRGLADAGSSISALTAASVLVTPTAVPEPATMALLVLGGAALFGRRKARA